MRKIIVLLVSLVLFSSFAFALVNINDSILVHYTLDNDNLSGSVFIDSMNYKNITEFGTTTGATGNISEAIDAADGNDYLETQTKFTADQFDSGLTVAFYMKPDQTYGGSDVDWDRLIHFADGGTDRFSIVTGEANAELCVYAKDGNTEQILASEHCTTQGTWTQDIWYNIVFTFTGSRYLLYVNGVVDINDSEVWQPSAMDDVYFYVNTYNEHDPSFGLNIDFDEITIWNWSLSHKNVQDYYNNITAGVRPYEAGIPGAPANNAPTTPTWNFPSASPDRDNYNITFNWTSTDADSDPLNCALFINYTTDEMARVYYGNNTNFTASFPTDTNYKYTASCYDGTDWGANSSTRYFEIDTIYPVITVNNQGNLTTYIPYRNNISVSMTATDQSIYRVNISLSDSSGNITYSIQNETSSGFSLNLTGIIDISNLPNGTYKLNFSAVDSHTFGDLRGLTYSYSEGTISFFKESNPTTNLPLEFGYYSGGEVEKLTSTIMSNLNVLPFVKEEKGEFHFGAVFDMPASDFRFGWRQPQTTKLKLFNALNAHYIWKDEFYVDYDASVCIYDGGDLSNCRSGSPTVVSGATHDYIYYDYNLHNWFNTGDRLVFYTHSIGGLNFITETYEVYIDQCLYNGSNWIIQTNCSYVAPTSTELVIDGNITIANGGHLNLDNYTLNFSSTNQWLIFEPQTSQQAFRLFEYAGINT